jgi:hypothetical protein
VGLINQTPTKEQSPQINQNLTVYLYIQKGGFDESNPYRIDYFLSKITEVLEA